MKITITPPCSDIDLGIDAEAVRMMTEEYRLNAIANCIAGIKESVINSAKTGYRYFEFTPSTIGIKYNVTSAAIKENVEYHFSKAGFTVTRNDHSMVISW